jgi:hypothetical protein
MAGRTTTLRLATTDRITACAPSPVSGESVRLFPRRPCTFVPRARMVNSRIRGDVPTAPTDPGDRKTANWLPAPSNGRFALVIRAYLPDRTLLDGTYVLPTVEAA